MKPTQEPSKTYILFPQVLKNTTKMEKRYTMFYQSYYLPKIGERIDGITVKEVLKDGDWMGWI